MTANFNLGNVHNIPERTLRPGFPLIAEKQKTLGILCATSLPSSSQSVDAGVAAGPQRQNL